MLEILKGLCTPAKVYLAIAFIVSVGALINGVEISVVLVKTLFACLWTYILNLMCKKGFKTGAWIIVLLPYVFIILAILKLFYLTNEQKKIIRDYGIEISYEEGFTPAATVMTGFAKITAAITKMPSFIPIPDTSSPN
jgi:hypothetical protein